MNSPLFRRVVAAHYGFFFPKQFMPIPPHARKTRTLLPTFAAIAFLVSVHLSAQTSLAAPGSIGTAPGEFTHGHGTATSTTVRAHLPEDVPPTSSETQTGRMNCFRESNSSLFGVVCMFVNWNAYSGGYQHGTGTVVPGAGADEKHPYGYDRDGNFRQADTYVGLWNEQQGGWRQVAGFGDYIDGDGRLCGCFRDFEGCFAPGTKITMADQTEKAVDDLAAGDEVWNPILRKAVRVKRILEGPEARGLVEVGIAGHRLTVTTQHPMLVESNGSGPEMHRSAVRQGQPGPVSPRYYFKKADDLQRGDRVQGEDGKFHAISTFRKLSSQAGQTVINFELEGPADQMEAHMVLSDGIVTGDIRAQWNLDGLVEQ